MNPRNTTNVKVALDSKAARFNVKKTELAYNKQKSDNYRQTVNSYFF